MLKVLCDMDGVLDNFVLGACQLHDKIDPYIDSHNYGKWDMAKIWKMSNTQFWKNMDREFWANLRWYPEGKEILSILFNTVGIGNVCLLTSPCGTDGCMDGKRDWIRRAIPELANQYLIGPVKQFCASQDHLLIDDMDHNILAFKEAGGLTFQVPRPWNGLHSKLDTNWIQQLSNKISFLMKGESNFPLGY